MKQLPNNENNSGYDYVVGSGQYKLLHGEYPTEADEILLVVDSKKQTLTDIVLAQLGFYPQDEFLNIAKRAMAENDEENEYYRYFNETKEEDIEKDPNNPYPYHKSFTFKDLVDKKLVYYPHNTIYSFGDVMESASTKTTINFVYSSIPVSLPYDEILDGLDGKIEIGGYSTNLTLIRSSDSAPIDPSAPYYGTFENAEAKITIINEDGIDKVYDSNHNLLGQDEGTTKVIRSANEPQAKGYQYPAVAKDDWSGGYELKIKGIAIAGDDTQFGSLSRGVYFTDKFTELYMNDALNSDIVRNSSNGIMAHIGSTKELKSSFKAYVTYEYDSYKNNPDIPTVEKGYASCLNADMNTSFANMFSGFSGGLNYFEIDKIYLRSLSGLSVKKIPATGSQVYTKPGIGDEADIFYTFEKLPQSISLYPTSFEMKKVLTDYLDEWNVDKTININGTDVARTDRDDLTYVDTIETIIAVITTLIDIVSVALIIFTSLSLVVSCFMIAVITYISVMERVKEIGIIRSLGGRKKDVTRLFTAENLITGLSSGVIGIAFTYLLQLIANLILRGLSYPAIASLSVPTAFIMIGISILLSVISGAIPSRNASKQDPVVALRTE